MPEEGLKPRHADYDFRAVAYGARLFDGLKLLSQVGLAVRRSELEKPLQHSRQLPA